jgi:hypothetical protein
MKKILLFAVVAAGAAAAVVVASKRPIEQPVQPSGKWEATPVPPTS